MPQKNVKGFYIEFHRRKITFKFHRERVFSEWNFEFLIPLIEKLIYYKWINREIVTALNTYHRQSRVMSSVQDQISLTKSKSRMQIFITSCYNFCQRNIFPCLKKNYWNSEELIIRYHINIVLIFKKDGKKRPKSTNKLILTFWCLQVKSATFLVF
mgnify:CR=1 FL=1